MALVTAHAYRGEKLRTLSLSILSIFLIHAGIPPAWAQANNLDEGRLVPDGQGINLIVDSGRPVARAVQTLIEQYGYVITYEDPHFENEDDFADVASSVRKDYSSYPPGRAPKVLVPRMAHLGIRIAPPSNPREMADVLNRVISEQSTSDHGGHFGLVQAGNVFHVVPREVRDRNGNWQSQTSILDVPITVSIVDGSEQDMIRAIASQVSAAEHVKIVAVLDGGLHDGSSKKGEYNLTANDEIATDVLMRALNMSETKRTWFLFRGDGGSSEKIYALNILTVPERPNSSSKSGTGVVKPAATGSQTPAVSPIP